MNNQNFTIGILTVTATVLLVGLLLISTIGQNQAMAIGQNDRGGDYIMATSQWRPEREVLWIVDARSQVIGMYNFDPQRKRLELIDTMLLGGDR